MKGQRKFRYYTELIGLEYSLCMGLAPEKSGIRDFVTAAIEFGGYLGSLSDKEFWALAEHSLKFEDPRRNQPHFIVLETEARRRGGRVTSPGEDAGGTRADKLTTALSNARTPH